jgi:hypothetical protein
MYWQFAAVTGVKDMWNMSKGQLWNYDGSAETNRAWQKTLHQRHIIHLEHHIVTWDRTWGSEVRRRCITVWARARPMFLTVSNESRSVDALRQSLWSSGQSSWLQIQRSRVRFSALPEFLRNSGFGTGVHSALLRITEELLEWKSRDGDLENRY